MKHPNYGRLALGFAIMIFGIVTSITAFDTYANQSRASDLQIFSVSYFFPDAADTTWSTPASYASFVDNPNNEEVLRDYISGQNLVLYRPKLPSSYSHLKFQGWYTQDGNLVTQITYEMSGDLTFYGIFKEAKYEIIYDTFNGYWANSSLTAPPTLITQSDINNNVTYLMNDFPIPTRGDYVFYGWYYTMNYSDFEVTKIECAGISGVYRDIYLYARWLDPITGEPLHYASPMPEVPRGFFGMIMDYLDSLYGNAVLGLIIIAVLLLIVIVVVRSTKRARTERLAFKQNLASDKWIKEAKKELEKDPA